MSIVAECFAGRPEQRQQRDRKRVQQPQAVTPLGRADMDRSHAHAEARILGVSQPALDAPALAVEAHQSPRSCAGAAGGQTPGLFHLLVLHAQHGPHLIVVGRHQGGAQDARASAGSNKGGGGACFARRGGHRDVAAEADDVVEFQFLGQHPVELLIAEPAIGHDAHLDCRSRRRRRSRPPSGPRSTCATRTRTTSSSTTRVSSSSTSPTSIAISRSSAGKTRAARRASSRARTRSSTGPTGDKKVVVDAFPDVIQTSMRARDEYIQRVPPERDKQNHGADYAFYAADQYYLYGHFDQAEPRFEAIYKERCGKDALGYEAWKRLIVMSNLQKNAERSRELAEAEKKNSCAKTDLQMAEEKRGDLTDLVLQNAAFEDANKVFEQAKAAPPGPQKDALWRKAGTMYEAALRAAPGAQGRARGRDQLGLLLQAGRRVRQGDRALPAVHRQLRQRGHPQSPAERRDRSRRSRRRSARTRRSTRSASSTSGWRTTRCRRRTTASSPTSARPSRSARSRRTRGSTTRSARTRRASRWSSTRTSATART